MAMAWDLVIVPLATSDASGPCNHGIWDVLEATATVLGAADGTPAVVRAAAPPPPTRRPVAAIAASSFLFMTTPRSGLLPFFTIAGSASALRVCSAPGVWQDPAASG